MITTQSGFLAFTIKGNFVARCGQKKKMVIKNNFGTLSLRVIIVFTIVGSSMFFLYIKT